MGPIIRVPEDLAQHLEEETDLVEAVIDVPDAVGEPDVQLGPPPGVLLLLVETPKDGFGRLVSMITDYALNMSPPLQLSVSDKEGNPQPFPGRPVNGDSIRAHLQLAYFGELGTRRPLISQ
jgi:hypothetical protein